MSTPKKVTILAFDSGIINCGVGVFESVDGGKPVHIKSRQFVHNGIDVKNPWSVGKVALKIYAFIRGTKPDVLVFEHNQKVATTIIYLIGAVIFAAFLKNKNVIIKRYLARTFKLMTLGHAGSKYDVKEKGKRKYSKDKKRKLMKEEMLRWVQKEYGEVIPYEQHDRGDTFTYAYTYWKKEIEPKWKKRQQ